MSRTRRKMLRRPLIAIGASLMAGRAAKARLANAPPALTPDAALRQLLQGNDRFVTSRGTAFEDDLGILQQRTADQQEPFAAVLSCTDFRVPVEIVFDQSIGHIFVTRVAGNTVTPEIVATLEYGASVLATKVIVVMGHADCAAVKAAMAGNDLEAAIKAHARIQSELLRKNSAVIAAMLKQKTIDVVPAYYDIATGRVSILQ